MESITLRWKSCCPSKSSSLKLYIKNIRGIWYYLQYSWYIVLYLYFFLKTFDHTFQKNLSKHLIQTNRSKKMLQKHIYLNIAKVRSVRKSPASDKPQPIHVMTFNSKGLAAVCETSKRRAKFVKWSHSHFTSLSFSKTFWHPRLDHFARKR